MELVQEIHQVLMDREDTCHRTCFSLQLDGVTLDNFAELKNIEGLKEGSVIKVSMLTLPQNGIQVRIRKGERLFLVIQFIKISLYCFMSFHIKLQKKV